MFLEMFESCFLIANFRDLFLVYAGLYIRYMSVVPPFTWAKYFDPTLLIESYGWLLICAEQIVTNHDVTIFLAAVRV